MVLNEHIDILDEIECLEKRVHHLSGSKKKHHIKEIKELQKRILELEEQLEEEEKERRHGGQKEAA